MAITGSLPATLICTFFTGSFFRTSKVSGPPSIPLTITWPRSLNGTTLIVLSRFHAEPKDVIPYTRAVAIQILALHPRLIVILKRRFVEAVAPLLVPDRRVKYGQVIRPITLDVAPPHELRRAEIEEVLVEGRNPLEPRGSSRLMTLVLRMQPGQWFAADKVPDVLWIRRDR